MSRNSMALQAEGIDLEVKTAAHAFARSLAESSEFQAFERASERLGRDEVAQQAIQAFQEKQQSLHMLLRLNAVSPVDRAELERLQKAFLDQPAVVEYMEAQEQR